MSDKWFERWGWSLAAACLALVALNIWMIAGFDGGAANWIAIVICSLSGGFAAAVWLEGRH